MMTNRLHSSQARTVIQSRNGAGVAQPVQSATLMGGGGRWCESNFRCEEERMVYLWILVFWLSVAVIVSETWELLTPEELG